MDPAQHLLCMLRPAIPGREGAEHLLVILSAEAEDRRVQLPSAPGPRAPPACCWTPPWRVPSCRPRSRSWSALTVAAGSVVVLGITPD